MIAIIYIAHLFHLLISGVGKPDHDMGLGYPGGLITRRAVSVLLIKVSRKFKSTPRYFFNNHHII